jgi:uncharacterized protein YraI
MQLVLCGIAVRRAFGRCGPRPAGAWLSYVTGLMGAFVLLLASGCTQLAAPTPMAGSGADLAFVSTSWPSQVLASPTSPPAASVRPSPESPSLVAPVPTVTPVRPLPPATATPVPTAPPATTAPVPTATAMPATAAVPIATAVSATTHSPQPSVTVGEAAINLRAGPGTEYNIVGRAVGHTYPVTGRNAAATWWQIAVEGRLAWISSALVKARDTGAVPVVANIPPPSTCASTLASPSAAVTPAGDRTFRVSRLSVDRSCMLALAVVPAVAEVPGITVELYQAETGAFAWRETPVRNGIWQPCPTCSSIEWDWQPGSFGSRLNPGRPGRYYFKVLWIDPRLGRLDPAPTISAAVRSDGTVVVADDGTCRLEP